VAISMTAMVANIGQERRAISTRAFNNIKTLIYKIAGISLSDAKKNLVEGRLNKRLRSLQLASFDEYYDYLISKSSENNEELQLFVDLLTTNETYFFREQLHFDFLIESILPSFQQQQQNSNCDKHAFSVWSAASSSGEEGYTLCMLLAEHLGIENSWRVLGTDISSTILADARQGIYNEQRIRLVATNYRHKYLLKGVGTQQGNFAVVPELKKHIKFESFNLIESCLKTEKFDVIFCRNVLIYFDHQTKEKVINRLCKSLKPGGYLISGRSESLHSLSHSLTMVMPSIYQNATSAKEKQIYG